MLIQRYVPKSVFFHSACDIDVYLFLSRLLLSFPFLRILYFTPLLFLRSFDRLLHRLDSTGSTPRLTHIRQQWPHSTGCTRLNRRSLGRSCLVSVSIFQTTFHSLFLSLSFLLFLSCPSFSLPKATRIPIFQ